jgi:hypothetical protein
MTDPTTLSAAELDEIANREVCFTNGIGWRIVLTAEECDALIAQARRTEAAERTLAKAREALAAWDAGQQNDLYALDAIRRALAED